MKKALIVIDFINDIVHPQGKIASCAQQVQDHDVISHANHAITWARANSILPIFIKVGFNPSYQDVPTQSPMFGAVSKHQALALNHWGTEFHQDLAINNDDIVIIKPRVSPFYNTSLDSVLRANNIDALYFCGVSTTWAIQAAVRDAHDRDYPVHIVSNACAAASLDEHQQSLTTLSRLAQLHLASDLC
ncbi:cysteine hydrolase family protein [Shewanella marina]|uniref:cysteine hydrolase family protein n=1 Tax=Shewanella marina TaxID=487319 RepID=UPI00046F137E|nr:cysteine hydrolase [Shewanella marina]